MHRQTIVGMGSDNISRYGEVILAVSFRLGTGNNGALIRHEVYHDDFNISEDALINGVKNFVQFVTDN